MNERIESVVRYLSTYLADELEKSEKTSIELNDIGVIVTAMLVNDIYIVQTGNIVVYGPKVNGLHFLISKAIVRAAHDTREIIKNKKLAELAKVGLMERMKMIRDICKHITSNVREIESCARCIPETSGGKDGTEFYHLKQVIWKNKYDIENCLDSIKKQIEQLI